MRTLLSLLICLSVWLCPTYGQQSSGQSTKNKEIVKMIFEAYDRGDSDALGKYIAKDAIIHIEMPPGMNSTGLEAMKQMCKMQKAAFPDIKSIIHALAATGDTVMAYYTTTGTNSGSFFGMPATNKKINVEGVDIMRFENGKAVEQWAVFDVLKMMQQLGIMPSPPPGPSGDKPKE